MVVVFASLIGTTTSFIFNTKCVAPSPCTCSSNDINCYNKRLSQVPVFSKHNEQYSTISLQLQSNQLTSIPAYAFQNLSAVNASRVDIYLQDNNIVNIESHAFSGIEHAVTYLNLANNNLTHLPLALEGLSSLRNLYLLGNPLANLDVTVLANISSKLNTLTLSIAKFSSFPPELKVLTKLSSLTIDNIQFLFVHSTVFQAFETSLTSLEMSHASFESIPAAVCRLKSLTTFISNYSPNLGKYNASIFDECPHRITTVTYLTLQNDQLTVFPKLASVFPHLHSLDLRYNLLSFIESTSFSGLTSLTTLYLSANKFTSVPSAIDRAKNLQSLYINNNQIHNVEDFDFQRLHKLYYIDLYYNPLVYLSPYAFSHNPLLQQVDLTGTKLGHIPRALLGLKHLSTIWLSGQPISCSCHAMSYLKTWNVSSMSISATCSSGKPVKTFLISDLPKCT